MPDAHTLFLAVSFGLLGLAIVLWSLGTVLGRRKPASLPVTTLETIGREPKRPDLALRHMQWQSAKPPENRVWLIASICFAAFSLLSLLIDGVTPLLVVVAPFVIISLVVDLIQDRGVSTTLHMDRSTLSISGSLNRTWAWEDITALGLNGDVSLLRVFDAQGSTDISLEAFPASERIEIARTLREHLEALERELGTMLDRPPVRVRHAPNQAGNAVHLFLVLAGLMTASTLGERGEPNVLGLRCTYSSHYLQAQFGLPDENGCIVLRVVEDSAAEKAGFRQGDLIVQLDDIPITSGNQFSAVFGGRFQREQTYHVIRAGEGEIVLHVKLSYPGKAADEDVNDPYFYYLRARSATSSQADQQIEDFTRAIELAPDFDMAYAYRGVVNASPLSFDTNPSASLPDFDKAISLDPNAEVYRSRARAHYRSGRFALAKEDVQTAIELDDCATAFEYYNYDCADNYYLLSLVEAIESNVEASATAAERAIEFYHDEPRFYIQAAREFWVAEDYASGRKYAARYLDLVGPDGDSINIDWATSILKEAPEQGELSKPQPLDRPPTVFIVEKPEGLDTEVTNPLAVDGEPVISSVRVTVERTASRPPAYTAIPAGDQQVWLYFEFDNADDVTSISYDWTHNNQHELGTAQLNGTREGAAWVALTNFTPGVASEGYLRLELYATNNGQPIEHDSYLTVRFVDEPTLGAGSFFTDPDATTPALFYDGSTPVYLQLPYANAIVATQLSWRAEVNSLPVAEGTVSLDGQSGSVTIKIDPEQPLPAGVLKVYAELGEERRTAWLAVVAPEVIQAHPFAAFNLGVSDELTLLTKDFAATDQPVYAFTAFDANGLEGSLRVQWYHNDQPAGFTNQYSEQELTEYRGQTISNPFFGAEDVGEYGVLVFIGDHLVQADLIVIHPPAAMNR